MRKIYSRVLSCTLAFLAAVFVLIGCGNPANTEDAGKYSWQMSRDVSAPPNAAVPKAGGLYFDYGRSGGSGDIPAPGRYSVPLGRTLIFAPVLPSAEDSDGSEYYTFSPTEQGNYLLTVSTEGGQISTLVECTAPEGEYKREKKADSKAKAVKVFEFTPAPGQFVGNRTNALPIVAEPSSVESARLAAQDAVDTADDYQKPASIAATAVPYSLGGWGGYIVFGFDHSVENSEGPDLYIKGNAFTGWSEAGVIWVMQDENGNDLPDDTWYELAGGAQNNGQTLHRYSMTWYAPDEAITDESDKHPDKGKFWVNYGKTMGGGRWEDNGGYSDRYLSGRRYTAGSYYDTPGKWSSTAGYPYWAGVAWVTFTGTLLPYHYDINDNGFEKNPDYGGGYVDDLSSAVEFDINNAIQMDGTPVHLKYVDFVKVQCAAQGFGPQTGEVSTELTVPYDVSLVRE
jgi:hypothetical protein